MKIMIITIIILLVIGGTISVVLSFLRKRDPDTIADKIIKKKMEKIEKKYEAAKLEIETRAPKEYIENHYEVLGKVKDAEIAKAVDDAMAKASKYAKKKVDA